MKRIGSLVVLIALVIGFGVIAYDAFFDPEGMNLARMSFGELLRDGDFWNFIIFSGAMLMFGIFEVFSLRDQPPGDIKNGVTAEARVIKVWDTGTTINDDPQVGLLLQVSPPGGAPAFQAEAKTVVPLRAVPFVKPGTAAEVKYDPKKPARLQLLALHVQAAPARDAAGRLGELEALREKGLITVEEYRQKREEILGTPK
jgi:hypothetical protein